MKFHKQIRICGVICSEWLKHQPSVSLHGVSWTDLMLPFSTKIHIGMTSCWRTLPLQNCISLKHFLSKRRTIWLRLALSRSSGYKSKWCKITDRVTTKRLQVDLFFKRAYHLEQLFSNNVFQTVIKKVHFGSFVVFVGRNFAEVTSRRGPCCRPRQWNFIFEQPNVICRKIQKEIQIISQ